MAKKSGKDLTAETQRRRGKARTGFIELTGLKKTAENNPENPVNPVSNLRASAPPRLKSSSLLDTRVIYCGDNLEQLAKLPDACVDLIYIDPPFNSNRNFEVFWGETKEKRAFEDRHESTRAYIDYMRPRCVQLARVLKKTGSLGRQRIVSLLQCGQGTDWPKI